MSIRARIEDTAILYTIGRPEAALLCALTAVAATSRKRYPLGAKSLRDAQKPMGDTEAFTQFLKDEMPRICGVRNFTISFRGKMLQLEEVLYKWVRCQLAHEAELPCDVYFGPDSKPGATTTGIALDGSLTLSHGWLDRIVDAVVYAPENKDEFGDPSAPPFPIHLPQIGLTVGSAPLTSTPEENREKA